MSNFTKTGQQTFYKSNKYGLFYYYTKTTQDHLDHNMSMGMKDSSDMI